MCGGGEIRPQFLNGDFFMKRNEKKLELLAPAGSLEIFKAVIHAGADAVYLGGHAFGARAYANNFSEEELLQAIDYAHIHDRQIYLTVNTLFKEHELEKQLYDYLLPYYRQGLDAVIVQDLGAVSFLRREFPDLDIHTSTQMTVCNRYGAQMMKDLGATRVVTAREMSFEEIRDISEHVDIEIESFIHGALCYCFSGQCLLSSMLGGRSGNRGRCAQPCRLPYDVFDEHRKRIAGVEPFVLSPKDLCTIEYIPQLAESGIFSFKIEGRMKQAEYAAGVVSVYRKYMDMYLANGAKDFKVLKSDMQKLYDFGNRSGFTKGYYEKHNGKDMITFQKPNHAKGNDSLQAEIREKYIDSEIKEKINGKLRLYKEFPAKIEVSMNDITVLVEGDIVQTAQKQPLSLEKIEENMRKTGNTPFEFEKLIIDAEPDIFMPMKSLNQLRRDAIEQLELKLTEEFRRFEHSVTEGVCADKADNRERDVSDNLSVSIEKREQLGAILSANATLSDLVDDIYLDNCCYTRENFCEALEEDVEKIHAAKKKAFFVFPTVFRKRTSDFYDEKKELFSSLGLDGVVVKSYDAIEYVQQHLAGIDMIFDQNIYTYNNRAIKLFEKYRPIRITAPYELNRKELEYRNNANSEIVIYGNLSLMTSAQCVHANTGKCDKNPCVTYLKDRYGKYFPVKNNCIECYNTVYNTTPLMLFGYEKELRKAGFTAFRLAFTTETVDEVKEILRIYKAVFLTGEKQLKDVYSGEYTNGHYKRGVE